MLFTTTARSDIVTLPLRSVASAVSTTGPSAAPVVVHVAANRPGDGSGGTSVTGSARFAVTVRLPTPTGSAAGASSGPVSYDAPSASPLPL